MLLRRICKNCLQVVGKWDRLNYKYEGKNCNFVYFWKVNGKKNLQDVTIFVKYPTKCFEVSKRSFIFAS